MKIVLLASASCIHTARWANGLASRGAEVHLLSAHEKKCQLNSQVHFYALKNPAPQGYLTAVWETKKLLRQLQPTLVNAHYATGYGLLARLVGYRPTLLSVWGSDVYDFPNQSLLHRWLLRGNLKSATAIASTSHCMARKTRETYNHPNIYITPFGVDTDEFRPAAKPNELLNKTVIGTVKTLKPKYGIDLLLRAFAQAWRSLGQPSDLVLEITGGGAEMAKLKALSHELGITGLVSFHGQIEHHLVPSMVNRLDIYVALSRLDSESFGVAALEAAACEKPVVVSDAEGLAEVTQNGKTGIVVPKKNVDAAGRALSRLITDHLLRRRMGEEGRRHVLENYTWSHSLDTMLAAYQACLTTGQSRR